MYFCRSQIAIIFITHVSFFNLNFFFFWGGGGGTSPLQGVHGYGPYKWSMGPMQSEGLVHVLSSPKVDIIDGRLGLTLHVIVYNHIGAF